MAGQRLGRVPHPVQRVHGAFKALTKEGILGIMQAFADGARRVLKAGVDLIVIHNGALVLEPCQQQAHSRVRRQLREPHIRLTLEVVDAVRAVISKDMLLFLRISATDWLEETMPNEPSWTSQGTVRLAPIHLEYGVDFLDVPSGGNHSM